MPYNGITPSNATAVATLFDQLGVCLIQTDQQWRVTVWNEQASRVYGWTRTQAIGKPITTLTAPTVDDVTTADIHAGLAKGNRWSGEYVAQRGDGSPITIFGIALPLGPRLEPHGYLSVSFPLDEQARHLGTHLRSAAEAEATFASWRADFVRDLASRLHNQFGGYLTGIRHELSSLAEHVNPAGLSSLRRARQHAEALHNALHQLLDALGKTDVVLPAPALIAANELENYAVTNNWQLRVDGIELLTRRTPDRTFARIVDAALRVTIDNVAAHAEAKHVTVSLEDCDTTLRITVCDDGKGFDSETAAGFGLQLLNAEVSSHGGTLRIAPNTPNGTIVTVELPW